jgi:membrane protein YdbS with pleckstrin-like domain
VAFSRRLLNEDEHVVVTMRTHVKALLMPAVWLILVAAVAGYASSFTSGKAQPLQLALVWGVALVVLAWSVGRPFLGWLTTTYTLTTRRLITRTGVLNRRGHDIPLTRISDVAYEHGLVDRFWAAERCWCRTPASAAPCSSTTSRRWSGCTCSSATCCTGWAAASRGPTATTATTGRGAGGSSMTEPEGGAGREELQSAILGRTPALTREAVAEAAGVSLEHARRRSPTSTRRR